ncbi:MAG: hypothetical protein GY720_03660 [bacterium]|nr:hypothetical protein [bacterium]
MFYAASEIVFWILLAAVAGGGIGYGVSQAKALRINKRLSQSRADAPMERELAIAWDTIEDLNRRLQVAHETIRDGAATRGEAADELIELAPAADTAAADPDGEAIQTAKDESAPGQPSVDPDTVIDMSVSRAAGAGVEEAIGSTANKPPAKKPAAKKPQASKAPTAAKPKTAATKASAAKTAAKKPAAPKVVPVSDDTVGQRLSDRVASASIANQVDFTDGGG